MRSVVNVLVNLQMLSGIVLKIMDFISGNKKIRGNIQFLYIILFYCRWDFYVYFVGNSNGIAPNITLQPSLKSGFDSFMFGAFWNIGRCALSGRLNSVVRPHQYMID